MFGRKSCARAMHQCIATNPLATSIRTRNLGPDTNLLQMSDDPSMTNYHYSNPAQCIVPGVKVRYLVSKPFRSSAGHYRTRTHSATAARAGSIIQMESLFTPFPNADVSLCVACTQKIERGNLRVVNKIVTNAGMGFKKADSIHFSWKCLTTVFGETGATKILEQ